MNRHRRSRGPVAIAVTAAGTAVLVAASWLLVGPSTLGGPFSYVFIRGSSMEPGLHNRDLVLLRAHRRDEVGDAVAYHHPELGTVLHRVVDERDGRFTQQGDNRLDVGTYDPRPEDVIGAVWVRVPGATPVIEAIQTPRNAALLVVAVGALRASRGLGRSKRPKRRTSDRGARAPARAPTGGPPGLASLGIYSAAGGLLAGLGVLLAAGSVALPYLVDPAATVTNIDTRAYMERSSFTYERTVLGGVYDGDRLTAPQPLFRRLASTLPVTFEYGIDAAGSALAIEEARGTLAIWGELSRGDGWSRRIELRPPLEFTGSHAAIESLVDLQSTDALMTAVAEATGVESGTYTLRVHASYEATARFAGQPIERAGATSMEFNVGELSVELVTKASDLQHEDSGSVPVIAVRPATISLPVVGTEIANAEMPRYVRFTRMAAGAVFLMVALASWLTWRGGEDARIRARHGALLLRASLSEHRTAARTVTVSTFADLARVAESEGLLVLHEPHLRGGTEYRVFANEATYRYRSAAASSVEDAPPAATDDASSPGAAQPLPFGPPPGPAPVEVPGDEPGAPASSDASIEPAPPPSALPPLRRKEDAA